ncbi:MAG: hypothetical protein JW745_00060 [Sedimentisphaerales bacterium]|nr:hypothetical protein [Sedimentisphaerales bacterium]MBN2842421.1 hypothetical protein [Sedimentisphaerales bacterium]
MNKIRKYVFIVIMVMAIFIGPAQAANDYEQLQPWLEDQTIAVLSVDVSQVDTQAVFDEAKYYIDKYLPEVDAGQALKEIEPFRIQVDGYLTQFKNDGVRSINLFASLNDLTGVYAVVIHEPGKPCPTVNGLVQMLNLVINNDMLPKLDTIVDLNEVMLIGSAATIQRIQNDQPADRQDISLAGEVVKDSSVKFLYAPSSDLRRVMSETLVPTVNDDKRFNWQEVIQSIQWATVGLDLDKKLELEYTIEAKDQAAAQKSVTMLEKNLPDIIKSDDGLRELIPDPNVLVDIIRPKITGKQLSKTLDSKLLRESLAPILKNFYDIYRFETGVKESMVRIKGHGAGMVLYANEHQGTLPVKYEDLTEVDIRQADLVSPLKDFGTGYIYRGSDLNDNMKNPGKTITVYEKVSRNDKVRYIVGFLDGHVEIMVSDAVFKAALAKDNSLRKEQGLAEKPEVAIK